MIENKILKKKKIPAKIASGEALFQPLVMANNQLQYFEKYLKQKRCAIRRLSVPNFCYLKKNEVNMAKKVKNCYKYAIST